MRTKLFPVLFLLLLPPALFPQRPKTTFRAKSELVIVSFTATEQHGKYVSGLTAGDVHVFEDGVEQKLKTFSDEVGVARGDSDPGSLFLLFDTSNSMYVGFPQAEDVLAGFIRKLPPGQSVALYSFCRNLNRLAPLTRDHSITMARLRQAVAGDDTALFNAILLTVRDAARVPGRKSIVVLSNGPDNMSMVSPLDVGRVAEDEGIPIYVISTREMNAVTEHAVGSLAGRTGGMSYLAASKRDQDRAFAAVQQDLSHTYTLTYSPLPNANQGYRRIEIRVDGHPDCRVRARAGYTPQG